LCAIWVAFSHGAYPKLTYGLDTTNPLLWFINGVYTSVFCGPAAVIIFFIISGFCIHYPYRKKWIKKNTKSFIIARLIRIALPIIAATLITLSLKIKVTTFYLIIGWSIICEVFYYVMYPFFHLFINSYSGWIKLLLISFIPTFLAFILFPITTVNYPGVGPVYVILLGLPCWLLGVLLCYNTSTESCPSKLKLTFLRGSVLFFGLITHILALQEIIGHPFTLNFFAIIACFWIKNEIIFYQFNQPNKILEDFGKTSYSIYLLHGIPHHLIQSWSIINASMLLSFILYWITLFIITILFYYIIEKPSHILARKCKILFMQ
jgi:peptidoglycan/LPS O-acetylase OafA/YrhL